MPEAPNTQPQARPVQVDAAPAQADDTAAEDALVARAVAGRKPGAFQGQVQDGRAALGELITRHQDRVYAVCLRMVGGAGGTGGREAAADLTQETFVRAIQSLESFDSRSRLGTWLTRIAMNLCISHLRSSKVRRASSLDGPAAASARGSRGDTGIGLAGSLLRSASPSGVDLGEPDPAQRVQDMERSEQVLRALATLEPDERALLILRDVQGLDYEQIAGVLGIPVGTVKSRLFRARLALRQAISSE